MYTDHFVILLEVDSSLLSTTAFKRPRKRKREETSLAKDTELDKLLIQTLNVGKDEMGKKLWLYGPVHIDTPPVKIVIYGACKNAGNILQLRAQEYILGSTRRKIALLGFGVINPTRVVAVRSSGLVDRILGRSSGIRGVQVKLNNRNRVRMGESVVWAWGASEAQEGSAEGGMWGSGVSGSLVACSRWSALFTGHGDGGDSGVRRIYLAMCTYKTNTRSEDRCIRGCSKARTTQLTQKEGPIEGPSLAVGSTVAVASSRQVDGMMGRSSGIWGNRNQLDAGEGAVWACSTGAARRGSGDMRELR
ncbi:hypothetical protein B0H10DRAFT_2197402 [Mycena sp. CBHHK59/15]|nr:hypothetical protein B0H10DRAFT_2197402 [Mycena sp. CBHHK59/15]